MYSETAGHRKRHSSAKTYLYSRSMRVLTTVFLGVMVAGICPGSAVADDTRHGDDEGRKAVTEARGVSAAGRRGGGKVTVKGWATFSGRFMGSVEDKKTDAGPVADAIGAEMISADFVYRPELEDFFLRMEMTKIPPAGLGTGLPLPPAGDARVIYGFRFTAKNVPYEIRIHNIGTPDHNNANDPAGQLTEPAFVLFKCEEETLCLEVAKLKGGYGTTGERIVAALPLRKISKAGPNISEGDEIGGMYAYTAAADIRTGPVNEAQILDDARLTKKQTVKIPKKSVTVSVGRSTLRATLKDGYFNVSFPRSLFRGKKTTVRTKTCLGTRCVRQRFKVKA